MKFLSEELAQTYYHCLESTTTVHSSHSNTQIHDMCLGIIDYGLIEIQSQLDRNYGSL